MRKLLRSRKALSPVVAAIILIAVTVAVSIAVAAWMGALTFTFMKTEELKVISMAFDVDTDNITLTVRNTGTSKVTITAVSVNGYSEDTFSGNPGLTVDPASEITLTVDCTGNVDVKAGYKYRVEMLTGTGNKFYGEDTAPS